MDAIFYDIGLIIIIAAIAGYISIRAKQPLIPAYILVGIIIGPILGLITNPQVVVMISEIGIAFLLFMIGLEIDFKRLQNVALVASVGGILQVVLTFGLGFLVAAAFPIPKLEAIYIGLILAFSSTLVVVKILADKRELETLHARIIVGILLMQDVVAIFALSILSTAHFSPIFLLISILKGAFLIGFMLLISAYLLPKVFKHAAQSREVMLLMSLTTMFFFSVFANKIGFVMLYILEVLNLKQFLTPAIIEQFQPGFSLAIGAFVGGVSIANLPYKFEIQGKTRSLRDFFATIFFVSLGMQLVRGDISTIINPLIVFALFVILAKPLIIMLITSFFGYKKRPSFLTAISLSQVSEFSLIIVAQGLLLGHVSSQVFSMTILLTIITITTTSYFMNYEDWIYKKMSNILSIFERKITYHGHNLEQYEKDTEYDVMLCGYNRIGYSIFRTLQKSGRKLMVVDYNPEIIRNLIHKKVPCMYGDVGDVEVLDRLNLKSTKMIISTVPELQDNLTILKKTKETNKQAIIYVTASQIDEALKLYDAGADYVILAHFLGGEHASTLIESLTDDTNKILKNKIDHIQELKTRKEAGHEHPQQY